MVSTFGFCSITWVCFCLLMPNIVGGGGCFDDDFLIVVPRPLAKFWGFQNFSTFTYVSVSRAVWGGSWHGGEGHPAACALPRVRGYHGDRPSRHAHKLLSLPDCPQHVQDRHAIRPGDTNMFTTSMLHIGCPVLLSCWALEQHVQDRHAIRPGDTNRFTTSMLHIGCPVLLSCWALEQHVQDRHAIRPGDTNMFTTCTSILTISCPIYLSCWALQSHFFIVFS